MFFSPGRSRLPIITACCARSIAVMVVDGERRGRVDDHHVVRSAGDVEHFGESLRSDAFGLIRPRRRQQDVDAVAASADEAREPLAVQPALRRDQVVDRALGADARAPVRRHRTEGRDRLAAHSGRVRRASSRGWSRPSSCRHRPWARARPPGASVYRRPPRPRPASRPRATAFWTAAATTDRSAGRMTISCAPAMSASPSDPFAGPRDGDHQAHLRARVSDSGRATRARPGRFGANARSTSLWSRSAAISAPPKSDIPDATRRPLSPFGIAPSSRPAREVTMRGDAESGCRRRGHRPAPVTRRTVSRAHPRDHAGRRRRRRCQGRRSATSPEAAERTRQSPSPARRGPQFTSLASIARVIVGPMRRVGAGAGRPWSPPAPSARARSRRSCA